MGQQRSGSFQTVHREEEGKKHACVSTAIDYSDTSMSEARTSLGSISNFVHDAQAYMKGQLQCPPVQEAFLWERYERRANFDRHFSERTLENSARSHPLTPLLELVHGGQNDSGRRRQLGQLPILKAPSKAAFWVLTMIFIPSRNANAVFSNALRPSHISPVAPILKSGAAAEEDGTTR